MTTVTGLTADRMLAIEDASVIDGDVVGDNLILTKHDGTQINAGNVRGPQGNEGPTGSDLDVITAAAVLDVGIANQIRAGRELTATDFTNMGLSAPIGLWNLSNLNDSSGNGRNLLNKGSVPFDAGINGVTNTAASFSGSTAQALYILDTGTNDPFRIRTGSWGCWFKTAKKATEQVLISKWVNAGNQRGWLLELTNNNIANIGLSFDGLAALWCNGVTDCADNRWHFVVGTFDGTCIKNYMDGILEGFSSVNGTIFGTNGPLNIGTSSADGSNSGIAPSFGRIDEAFVTADILTEDQVRNLYCAKIPHALGQTPKRVSLRVRRLRHGAALVAGDFPTQPLRLYNFSAGALTDEGSNNQVLTNNGTAVPVAGADGTKDNAFNFNGTTQSLSSTDTGLPSGINTRSYGCWFKTTTTGVIMGWGTASTSCRMTIISGSILVSDNIGDRITGPFIGDGLWHFAVSVEENAPLEGIKRKLYVDGKLVGISLVLNAVTLGGATFFRIGAFVDGSSLFNGQVDGAFVCDYVLTSEDILSLYAKGSQSLGISPKNSGDHIEKMTSTDLLVTFDTLDSCHQVDLAVA